MEIIRGIRQFPAGTADETEFRIFRLVRVPVFGNTAGTRGIAAPCAYEWLGDVFN